ncbi:hypothetical protein Tco_0228568, partial [Tanacetum coccineum]
KHNMVAYLKKPTGSAGFQEIVDFLNGSHIRQALDEDTQLPQTSVSIPNVADEVVFKEWDDRVVRATTTAASLDAAQASGNITKTQSTAIPNVPLPQGISAGGSPRCQEAMGVSLLRLESRELGGRLEANKEGITLVTPTKDSSQEDQPKDQFGVLSAAKVLADAAKKNVNTYTRRRRAVSTGSGGVSTASRLFSTVEESVSTAGASMPVNTAGMVQEVNKDKAVRLQEQLDEEERQRIARMHEEAKSFHIEEWENIQATIEADEELAQRIQAEEREKYSEAEKARLLAELINQRKRYFT